MNFLKKFQLKTYVIASILIMSLPGVLQFGYQNTLPQMVFAVAAAALIDLLINKFQKGPTFFFPSSGIISGLIVATVLSPGSVWYAPVLGASAAVLSKHIIKIKMGSFSNHIFNPANLGLFVLVLSGIATDSWWIGTSPLLVAVLGLFLLWKMSKLTIIAPFFVFFLISTAVVNLFMFGNLNNILLEATGGSLLFFMFIMVQEPVTAPRKGKHKIVFGSLIGILGPVLLAMPLTGFVSIYLSLIIGDLLVPVLGRLRL